MESQIHRLWARVVETRKGQLGVDEEVNLTAWHDLESAGRITEEEALALVAKKTKAAQDHHTGVLYMVLPLGQSPHPVDVPVKFAEESHVLRPAAVGTWIGKEIKQ